jgi:hypothetical protein
MHWYRFISDDQGITVTMSWWVLVAYIAAILGGVFLFRFAAVGGLPWVFSRIGSGRLGIYAAALIMVPAGALMIFGGVGIYQWERYKLQIDKEGVYWRHEREIRQGTWDQLWTWQIYQMVATGRRDIHLEFYQGDTVDILEDKSLGENFSRLVDFAVQRAQAADRDGHRRRLLEK